MDIPRTSLAKKESSGEEMCMSKLERKGTVQCPALTIEGRQASAGKGVEVSKRFPRRVGKHGALKLVRQQGNLYSKALYMGTCKSCG